MSSNVIALATQCVVRQWNISTSKVNISKINDFYHNNQSIFGTRAISLDCKWQTAEHLLSQWKALSTSIRIESTVFGSLLWRNVDVCSMPMPISNIHIDIAFGWLAATANTIVFIEGSTHPQEKSLLATVMASLYVANHSCRKRRTRRLIFDNIFHKKTFILWKSNIQIATVLCLVRVCVGNSVLDGGHNGFRRKHFLCVFLEFVTRDDISCRQDE